MEKQDIHKIFKISKMAPHEWERVTAEGKETALNILFT